MKSSSILRKIVFTVCLTAAIFISAGNAQAQSSDPTLQKAVFAGGCFWCMEPPFDKLDGVIATISGYVGGHKTNPTYKEVSAGTTGHTEAVEITFDPARITYDDLLKVYWVNIDPTVRDRQFCDKGSQYRTGIFYNSERQKQCAQESLDEHILSGKFDNIFTVIVPAGTFYPAEEYHQNYYIKNPIRYKYYRWSCGRDSRLKELWGGK